MCREAGLVTHLLTTIFFHSPGLNEAGEATSWQARGWAARIIQHEMDHLQGVLYLDKMDCRTFANVRWAELNE